MEYDAFVDLSFKRGEDGRIVFFPWGGAGRGYVVSSDDELRRLRGVVRLFLTLPMRSAYTVGALLFLWRGWEIRSSLLTSPIGESIVALFTPIVIATGAILAIGVTGYAVWASRVARRLQPSDERISGAEVRESLGRSQSLRALRSTEIGCVVMGAGSALALLLQPGEWMLLVPGLILFGAGAVWSARALRARRFPEVR